MNLRIIQKWLTAAAENSSQLFSRKPWLINCIRQVFWLNPISRLPALAVACGGNSPANCGLVYTATGIASGFNRTSLLMKSASANLNRMHCKVDWFLFGKEEMFSTICEKELLDFKLFLYHRFSNMRKSIRNCKKYSLNGFGSFISVSMLIFIKKCS